MARRAVCTLLVLLAWFHQTAPTGAEPTLVRVIWDVGQKQVYVKQAARNSVGHVAFNLPASEREALKGIQKLSSVPLLRKSDRVPVYVVNYFPVKKSVHGA